MIQIIAGTNRPGSRSLQIAQLIQREYTELGVDSEVLDLRSIPLHLIDGSQYSENQPLEMQKAVEKVDQADGLVVVCPEYNGSMPGALKYFIDHWSYPKSFQSRPVAFVGLGGKFGGLRPVEHLQQVFGYRNAYIFPERVFLFNVWDVLDESQLKDKQLYQMIKSQCEGFSSFIEALKKAKLHTNCID